MSKFHQVLRVIGGTDGTQMVVALQAYEDPELAKQKVAESMRGMQSLLQCRLIRQTGPERGVDSGLTLAQFLQEFGIQGFQDIIRTVEVQGLLTKPSGPKLVVPG